MAVITLNNCQITINRIGYASSNNLRRVQEYLAACGPSSFLALLGGMGIINYVLLDQLAAARDLDMIELVDGRYQLVVA